MECVHGSCHNHTPSRTSAHRLPRSPRIVDPCRYRRSARAHASSRRSSCPHTCSRSLTHAEVYCSFTPRFNITVYILVTYTTSIIHQKASYSFIVNGYSGLYCILCIVPMQSFATLEAENQENLICFCNLAICNIKLYM